MKNSKMGKNFFTIGMVLMAFVFIVSSCISESLETFKEESVETVAKNGDVDVDEDGNPVGDGEDDLIKVLVIYDANTTEASKRAIRSLNFDVDNLIHWHACTMEDQEVWYVSRLFYEANNGNGDPIMLPIPTEGVEDPIEFIQQIIINGNCESYNNSDD